MAKEIDTITKEFEKLVEENREEVTKAIEQNKEAVSQLEPVRVRCTPGEVCHGGDIIQPK